jgi:hypothetical protein
MDDGPELHAPALEEEHLGLYRMGFRTTQDVHTGEIALEFGCDGNWLLLGTLEPFDCDDGEQGYTIHTEYSDSSPYRCGDGLHGPSQHRLIFALRHLIGWTDVEIADHMNAIPFELPDD